MLLPGLPSLLRRAADGLSTRARRTPLALVLPLLTPVGVKTQVTRIVSPALARVIGEASGVKYVVQEALFAPTVVTKWPVETVAVPEPV